MKVRLILPLEWPTHSPPEWICYFKKVIFHEREDELVEYKAKANFKVLGKELGPLMKVAAGIIAELAKFLTENSENACENVEITNKERQIAFKIGENAYELTLIQKRKPKEWWKIGDFSPISSKNLQKIKENKWKKSFCM